LKAIIHRLFLIGFLITIFAANTFASTFDWSGTKLVGGVYNWNTIANWKVNGLAATRLPNNTDIVRVAVTAYTNDPTITDAQSCAVLILGVFGNLDLTVNGTLTVLGDITQNNDPDFFQTTKLAGAGTIICKNFNVGDNTQPTSETGVVTAISSTVKQLTINGNLTLNAAGNNLGDGIEYPFFSLDANKLLLYGQIKTSSYSNPKSGAVDDPLFPGIGLFQADSYAAATTIELPNNNPIVLPIVTGFTIDFTNNGPGLGTVIYDAAAGTQAIYTTATTGLGIVYYNYDYLLFSGASAKLAAGGAFTIGKNWTTSGTGAVNLNTNNPTVSIGGVWANSTTVTQGTGSITVTGPFINTTGIVQCGTGNIVFKGNYTNSKTFNVGTGTISFSGATQTLLDNGTGTIFNKVTFNGTGTSTMTAGVGNFSVSSTGLLTLVSPAKLVTGAGAASFLTLKSGATSSATVTALSGTSTITGNVNVERYLTGGSATYRSYRLLSSPVYAATVGGNNVYSINYLKKSSYLTGTLGALGGFDKAGNPTLYLYRENTAVSTNSFSAGNFRGINSIVVSPNYLIDGDLGIFNIPVGNGFLFFFRGDRSTTLASKTIAPYTNPENTTLVTTGSLNQGQVTVKDWYTPASANLGYTTITGNASVRGYNLVGNPYASSINWDLYNTTTPTTGIYASGVGTTIYVFDPSSKNYGAYTKGLGVGTHNASSTLASGQGFFVVATSAAAKLTFNESAKVNTQNTGLKLLMGKPVDDYANNQYIRLQLNQDSVNNDDIVIHFSSGASTDYVQDEDAPYKPGYGTVSMASISSNNVTLAINNLPLPKTSQTIDLAVNTVADGTYNINMKELEGVPQLFDVWLMDTFKKDSADMRHNTTYTFEVSKSDTNSFGTHRFKLVIRQNTEYAYQLLNFTAAKVTAANARQVQATWRTKNEQNYTHFTVERSTDNGKNYEVLGGFASNAVGSYSIKDKNPVNGQNLYRLKQEDINSNISYSKVAPVEYSDLSNSMVKSNINVYPNPATNVIHLAVSPDANVKNYKITITNNVGLVIKEVTSAQPVWQGSVSELLAGTYFIQVISTKDKSFVGQAKFVKM